MSPAASLQELSRGPAGGSSGAGALVVLHGRGSDMHDSFGLARALDPRERLHVVAPQAPLSMPPGGWHWYELGGLPTPEPSTWVASMATLREWLLALPERTGEPLERTVVAGFSQGCMMTWGLLAGPDAPRVAGSIHIAGFLPRVPGHELDLGQLRARPALLVHGVHDAVIDISWGREARAAAEAAGVDVRWVEFDTGHDVDMTGARAMVDFLDEVLPDRHA